jgi:predicted nucleotidyltransferase
MLEPNEIIEKLQEKKGELSKRFSVSRIGLFGSYLRGTASETSDIDLLVDFEVPTFDHYMDLKFYLEDLFEHTVDLVLSDTLKPRLKPIAYKEVAYA